MIPDYEIHMLQFSLLSETVMTATEVLAVKISFLVKAIDFLQFPGSVKIFQVAPCYSS